VTHCEQHDANVPRRALRERPHDKYTITAAARDGAERAVHHD
jgi:hypothetical protein